MIELANDTRQCLGDSIRAYYERLNISLTNIQEEKLSNLDNLNIYLSEHGFLFPWLGIFRIPLMLHKRFKSDSIGIFIINDHTHRREQRWTRDLNIYFRHTRRITIWSIYTKCSHINKLGRNLSFKLQNYD